MYQDRKVAVYVVTYRRHDMLRRAIRSVLDQTHFNLVVHVINDDPGDAIVDAIVAGFGDARVRMYLPVEKRGATRNFNLAFMDCESHYASLLEDDNWWEPQFIERQIQVLESQPDAPLAISNERVWKEMPDHTWIDTGRTIWPEFGVKLYDPELADLCGSAMLCNSSMLIRTRLAAELLTPETIPVDVTEHFRERLLSCPVPLNGEALVNYAETIQTARGKDTSWGNYQIALIASAFMALAGAGRRERLAEKLWRNTPSATSPRATTLVRTGLAVREARALVARAPKVALLRTLAGLIRRPQQVADVLSAPNRLKHEIAFLATAPLTKRAAARFGGTA